MDTIGVTETWLHDGIRDDEICQPGYTLFRQDRPSHQNRGGVILYVKSNLLPQSVLLPPTTPSSLCVSLIACELLFNTEPSIIALVYRSPNTPPHDNISLICTLETIISRRPDCVVLGDFNRLKVNWASNTAPPNTVLIFVKFPNLISPIPIHPTLGKSDHTVLCWTYTSALPQLPPRPNKINPTRINFQTTATLALFVPMGIP